MFGSKYQAVFRSRWRALLWASGVLLTAYCTVPSPGEDDPAMEIIKTAAAHAGKGQSPGEQAPPKRVDPWALDR